MTALSDLRLDYWLSVGVRILLILILMIVNLWLVLLKLFTLALFPLVQALLVLFLGLTGFLVIDWVSLLGCAIFLLRYRG